ncbi:MAG: carbon-nitrogen hydrolase family protein [Bacteroidota bacterium]
MKNRIVRLSSGQLPAVLPGASLKERQSENLRAIAGMIQTAGKRGSDFILFGEYANLDHRSVSQDPKDYIADPIPGPFVDKVAALARKQKVNVALPVFGKWKGEISSYVVFLNRKGRLVDCYQKTHPTIAEQRLGITAGNDLKIVELDFGSVGTMTCMDIEYPEVAQVLMVRGAELLLFPHVQAGWGEVDWEIRYRSRSVDTGLPMVSACFGYPEGQWRLGKMIGRSGIIGRDGGILCEAGRGIGVVTADVDLAGKRVTEFYFQFPVDRTRAVQASRRPELYTDLARSGLRDRALKKLLGNKRKLKT